MKAAVFIDTFDETNGVSVIYKNMIEWNSITKFHELHFFVISSITKTEMLPCCTIHYIRPKYYHHFLFYPAQLMGIPDKKYINNVFNNQEFDFVLLTTPGIYCYYAKRIALKNQIPQVGFYHTRLSEMAKVYGERAAGKIVGEICKTFVVMLHKLLYGKCQIIFTQSKEMINDIRQFSNAEIKIIMTGVNQRIIRNENKKQFVNRTLIFVGRVALEKNLDILLPIIDRLNSRNIEFFIVGDGPYADEIKKRNISISGFVSQEEVFKHMSRATALIFPSITDTFGNVVVEAISCGLPVIVAKNTATAKFLIDNYDSVEFDPKNSDDLFISIVSIFDNYKRWEEIRNSYKRKKVPTWDEIFKKLFECVKDSII